MGLIYLHHNNSNKNYGEALESFRSVVKKYPESTRLEEAKTWIGVLEGIENSRKIDLEIDLCVNQY